MRDVREDDIPILIAYFAEPESRQNILSFQANEAINKRDLENAIAWAKIPEREYYSLSVTLKDNHTLIGTGSISQVKPESFSTFIGWHYGNNFRGNGYATEAARALLYIGFELNEVANIYADCFAENKASIRIMEKIGMSPVWNLGLFNIIRGWSYGEYRPAVRYTISRNQWFKQTADNIKIC